MINRLKKAAPGTDQFLMGVFGFYLVYLLFLTLRPFEFSLEWAKQFLENPGRSLFAFSIYDVVGNIFLFMPFGALLTATIERRPHTAGFVLVMVISAGLLLSGLIEFTQIFLNRSPNITDVITNTTGTAIGCAVGLARIREQKAVRTGLTLFQSPKLRLFVFIIYAFGLVGILFAPLRENSFEIWRENYPLVLGNEPTNDRPWFGTLHSLVIYDRALSSKEIYRLAETTINGLDSRKQLPAGPVVAFGCGEGEGNRIYNLIGDSCHLAMPVDGVGWASDGLGLRFSGGVVQDKLAGKVLTRRIKESNHFTVALWLKAASIDQQGPARIVGLSPNVNGRNFTLAQQQTDFHFRVRSRLLGWNGSRPALVTHAVLADTSFHHVAATFSPGASVFYYDGIQKGAALSLFRDFLPIRFLQTNSFAVWLFSFVILLLPLSLLIYHWLDRWRFWGTIVLIAGYVLIVEMGCQILHGQPTTGLTVIPGIISVMIAKLSEFYFRPFRHKYSL